MDPVSKQVQVLETKTVIGNDLQNMKLPESHPIQIIPKDMITQNVEIRAVINYLQTVQPSLAAQPITDSQIEQIGTTKKITLMQTKNNQPIRVVVLLNEKTNEFKLIDESPVLVSPPSQISIGTNKDGQKTITTNNVDKMIHIDESTVKVVNKIQEILPQVDMKNTEGVGKVEGNLVNTFTFLVSGNTNEAPKQQVTVVQNKATQETKVIDYQELPTQVTVKPIDRPIAVVDPSQYKSPAIESVLTQMKVTNQKLVNTTVTVTSAHTEETKYVTKYILNVETQQGPQTVTAIVPVNTPQEVTITSVTQTISAEKKPQVDPVYFTKVSVDEASAVKTTFTSRP